MLQSALFRIICQAINFLAFILIANLLQPELYGKISLMILNAAITSLITGFGMEGVLMQYLTNNKWTIFQAQAITIKAIALQIMVFIAAQAVSITIWGNTILSLSSSDFLLFECVYFFGLILNEKFITLLYARHHNKIANQFVLIVTLIYFIAVVYLPYVFPVTMNLILSLLAAQSLLQGVGLVILFYHKEHSFTLKGNETISLHIFVKLASIVMVTNMIQMIAYRCDYWILYKYYSDFEVGIYSQANRFSNLVWIVPNILAFLLIPKFSTLNRKHLLSVFRLGFLLSLCLVLVTACAALFFYKFILQNVYSKGIIAFLLMLPGFFMWTLVIYYAAYFSWKGLFKINLIGSILCLLFIAIFDFLLIPVLSINGAAIANTIAYCFTLLVYLYILNNYFKFSFKDLFIFKRSDFSVLTVLNK